VQDHYDRLSAREREIMDLIASGKSSKQIGLILGISPRTVDAHRARLMAKMHASSLAELGAMSAACRNDATPVPVEEG
jgi:DNA-binding CsgD family transcriptional regulator